MKALMIQRRPGGGISGGGIGAGTGIVLEEVAIGWHYQEADAGELAIPPAPAHGWIQTDNLSDGSEGDQTTSASAANATNPISALSKTDTAVTIADFTAEVEWLHNLAVRFYEWDNEWIERTIVYSEAPTFHLTWQIASIAASVEGHQGSNINMLVFEHTQEPGVLIIDPNPFLGVYDIRLNEAVTLLTGLVFAGAEDPDPEVDLAGIQTITETDDIDSQAGKVGTALKFTAAALIDIDFDSSWALGESTFTMESWVFISADADVFLTPYMWQTGGSPFEFTAQYDPQGDGTAAPYVYTNAAEIYDSDDLITYGQWQHVVWGQDIEQEEVWIKVNNGTLRTQAFTLPTGTQMGGAQISSSDPSPGYVLINAVRIWNRRLSSDEITALYNSGNGVAFGDLA